MSASQKTSVKSASSPSPKHAQRRQQILDAAGELLRAGKLHAATTLDIATAASVSKRDLYAAFPSKDALIAAMISERVTAFPALEDHTPVTSRAEVYQRLEVFGRAFLTFILSPSALAIYRLAISQAAIASGDGETVGQILAREGVARTKDRLEAFLMRADVASAVTWQSRDAAIGIFFGALTTPMQMALLLQPNMTVRETDIERHVLLALFALTALEIPKSAPTAPTARAASAPSSAAAVSVGNSGRRRR
jgi:AcrR family transcriptional regulator